MQLKIKNCEKEVVMGLISGLMGDASPVSVEKATKEWGKILGYNENIVSAYKLVRDYIIFTPLRMILIDVQGVTGKSIEIKSIPYRSIISFSVQTAGYMDLNAELYIWLENQEEPIVKTFNSGVNIYEVQGILASFCK